MRRQYLHTSILLQFIALWIQIFYSSAWIQGNPSRRHPVWLASTTSSTELSAPTEEEDEEEYEYVEYETLTEAEFVNSEWLVGTNWDNQPDKISETWARLIVDKNGSNVAVWGDDSQGTWALDVASQFLSISKDNKFAGKEIWACTVDDYYFLRGTVRGWKFWSPAAVLAQWQGRRLGIDKEESGVAPWFEEESDSSSDGSSEEESTQSASE